MTGTLFGIGVGPGDPELMTLKARRVLGTVPVLAFPAPLEGEGMARAIAAPHVPAGKVEIAIRMAFRPERDDAEAAYDAAAAAIAGHLEAGRDVAVLCEGDPLFFGSFIYLLARLGPRFPVEVVPGIASPMAASALLARPLATLDDSVAIVPATRAEADIERLLALADSAVILKVGRHLPKVRRVLARLGLEHGAVVVERAGLDGQRVLDLDAASAGGVSYFSLILVHRRGTARP
ncbi:MAG: precorrin-2 C(20)-methyltransferase [Magnetospirillum sp.]|nr:precorrin-2 C(20)-methyltransferase [Magnetospirillum sp.]